MGYSEEYTIFRGPTKGEIFISNYCFYDRREFDCEFILLAKKTNPPDETGAPYLREKLSATIRDLSYEDGSGHKFILAMRGELQGGIHEFNGYYDTDTRQGWVKVVS